MCLSVFLHVAFMYVCDMNILCLQRLKRVSDPVALELRMVVNSHSNVC